MATSDFYVNRMNFSGEPSMSNYYGGNNGSPHPILSAPIRLHWAGWESTTAKLQQAGWQISAREDVSMDRMQIALQHRECQIRALSEMIDFHYIRNRYDPNHSAEIRMRIPWLASDIRVSDARNFEMSSCDFRAVDARTQMMSQEQLISQIGHFAVPLVRTQEIMLPDEDVNAILSRIIEKQEAAKQAYFAEKVRDERFERIDVAKLGPQMKFHAQIISLADRRVA